MKAGGGGQVSPPQTVSWARFKTMLFTDKDLLPSLNSVSDFQVGTAECPGHFLAICLISQWNMKLSMESVALSVPVAAARLDGVCCCHTHSRLKYFLCPTSLLFQHNLIACELNKAHAYTNIWSDT